MFISGLRPAFAYLLALGLILSACGSDKKKKKSPAEDDNDDVTTTYDISGNFDVGSYASFNAYKLNPPNLLSAQARPAARTVCTDGFYYAVYCLSYSSPPVAAEGDVDCAGDGAFTVEGLPKGAPVGCFVVRYESAVSTDPETVGAIQIPASNINGSSDTLVTSGDVVLSVSIDDSGTISATVVSGELDDQGVSDTSTTFTSAAINGVWKLECNSNAGGNEFSAGKCKCFLGEGFFAAAGYADDDACFNDPNGSGAAITETVKFGIGMYIYNATANQDIPMGDNEDDGVIPNGTAIKAISIWGTTGSGPYTSLKGSGGEGVSDLGGALSWATTPLNPTAAIAWTSGSVTIDDDDEEITFMLPSLTAKGRFALPATHAEWMTWIGATADAAQAAGFDCTYGPNDAAARTSGLFSLNNDCMNQVLQALRDKEDYILPRVEVRSYCDHEGCLVSSDIADALLEYYDADAQDYVHVELEGLHLDYPHPWTKVDLSATTAEEDGIGLAPKARKVFEPLLSFPGGAGFRQHHHDERRFHCLTSGGEVNNATCSSPSAHYELTCHYREELSIKFLGSAPFNVLFDQSQSVGYAELRSQTMEGMSVVNPTGTTALSMCKDKIGAGGGKFFAKATKQ